MIGSCDLDEGAPGSPLQLGLVATEARRRLRKRHVVASVSGGKDSTAMCLHLRELGIDYTPVFMDTGWENRETYRYLREELPQHIGEIVWLTSEVELPPDLEAIARSFEARMGHYSAMVRWVLRKGMFPSQGRRFCTEELKVRPMAAYVDSLDDDVVNAVGVRAQESRDRALLPPWEDPGPVNWIDAETWRPLLAWTVADVIAIHHRHGVRPNRNYLSGALRVGCWPCIRSAKSEIRQIATVDPERIALIADLEAVVADRARARELAKPLAEQTPDWTPPAWFQSRKDTRRVLACDHAGGCRGPICPTCEGTGRVRRKLAKHECWPIARVVAWSRSRSKGERFIRPEREAGCMRWGMCDLGGQP